MSTHFNRNTLRCDNSVVVQAQQLAGSYKGRHAGDRYLHNVTSQNDVFNKMGCQCAKKPGDPCIQSCDSGRDVRVYRHCWAGDIYNHTATAAYHTHDIQTFNRSVFADWMETSRKEVLRTGTLMKQSFAAEMCDTGRCLEANASTTWVLSHDDPCRPQCNCGGVYCTECKEGFSQLPSSAVRSLLTCVRLCVFVCVRACVHVCVRACTRACVFVKRSVPRA